MGEMPLGAEDDESEGEPQPRGQDELFKE